jgi:hypothetical protein
MVRGRNRMAEKKERMSVEKGTRKDVKKLTETQTDKLLKL